MDGKQLRVGVMAAVEGVRKEALLDQWERVN